jgi:hypothetical protein
MKFAEREQQGAKNVTFNYDITFFRLLYNILFIIFFIFFPLKKNQLNLLKN